LIDLSKSLIAAALSASNSYFWMHSGYFDGAAMVLADHGISAELRLLDERAVRARQ
jgi:hypothetical protein